MIGHFVKDGSTVKPGFKSIPPQLYFEFTAFFWPRRIKTGNPVITKHLYLRIYFVKKALELTP